MRVIPGRYIDPMVDVAFKRIFGEGGDKQLLIHLLNQVLRGQKIITDLVYNQN
ncbi:Rpn family recombination-promoting nuclease/putative transposase [Desertivirga brevis]|uniref:Rpn family recombination-promoting nuclease/putative transposase n=1 Tax=Desertivirga brevis TaxID=2810310 RepID=UPI002106FCCE|nr:Rpn family recombination-promoting nuclease/putative transposase [Pedobacter sp. SYSU D00873]